MLIDSSIKSEDLEETVKPKLTLVGTDSWKEIATIAPDASNAFGEIVDFSIACFSPSEKHFAMHLVRSTKTSEGYAFRRSVEVFETASGNRLHAIEMRRGPPQSYPFNRQPTWPPMVSFTSDGSSIITTEHENPSAYPRDERRLLVWRLSALDIATGNIKYMLENDASISPVAISSDSSMLIFRRPIKNRGKEEFDNLVLDTSRLVSLVTMINEGNTHWLAGEKKKAFSAYSSVLGDEMCGFFSMDLPVLWSRCVDYYAENGDVSSGRLIVDHAGSKNVVISPETSAGKQLLENYSTEIAQSKQRKEQERQAVYSKKVSELRSRNQQDFVPSYKLTKKEFIARLNSRLSIGQINSTYSVGQWDDYVFQDVFGEPDSNVEWTDLKRLIGYRCKDGLIQLTVTYVSPSVVVLHGVSEF